MILTDEETIAQDAAGDPVTFAQYKEALVSAVDYQDVSVKVRIINQAQDKLSRKDEREKMAVWLRSLEKLTPVELNAALVMAISLLKRGRRPWSDHG